MKVKKKTFFGKNSLILNKKGSNPVHSSQPTVEIMKTKRISCIIVHGCPSDIERSMDPKTRTYDKHWIPWLKKELTSRGIKTETPLMPKPWHPDYKAFKKKFEKCEVTDNSVLIGHSCGCAFLVR